jgi:hypothetical protein
MLAPPIARGLLRSSLILLIGLTGCAAESAGPAPAPGSPEIAYRRSLGIPDDARTVVVYSQSSHLDINWLMTFQEYQDRIVDKVVDKALDLLDSDPRAVYSMAEMGFLRPWWDRHPQDHDRLRKHVATGRFRIVGGAVTTPDTNLPPSESVIRDYVEGIRWIHAAAGATVSTAWIPDSFGHNPLVPDLLYGLGMGAVGFSRLDGGPGTPFKIPKGLARAFSAYEFVPGSHAAALKDGGTLSFHWNGDGAASILGMYMPFTYCLGESLGSVFPITPPGVPLNLIDDVPGVLREMTRYHEQLAPFGKTGYLFVPVGCDFQPPKELLTRFMDDWNRNRYRQTGTWALRATFEEYNKLVSFRQAELPTLALDGNPVWTGYYGERPRIKQLSFLGATWLTAHELLSVLRGEAPPAKLDGWWWIQALSNHHDWIPGTAPDRVYLADQRAVSEAMVQAAHDALAARLVKLGKAVGYAGPLVVALNPAGVRREVVLRVPLNSISLSQPLHGELAGGASIPVSIATEAGVSRVVLAVELPPLGYTTVRLKPGAAAEAPAVRVALYDTLGNPTTQPAQAAQAVLQRDGLSVTFRADEDWAATSVRNAAGQEWLAGPSDQWVVYHDTGGLYQIGSEQGCDYAPLTALPAPFHLAATSASGVVGTLVFEADLFGAPVTRSVSLARTGPIAFESTLRAPEWTTVVSRFQTAVVNGEHRNGVGYGSVKRPYSHLYTPSYWPATWSGLFGPAQGAIVSRTESTGFAATADGRIELMLKRNAVEEQCAGLGAGGHDDAYSTLHYALHPFSDGERRSAIAEAQAETLPPIAVLANGAAGGQAPLERFAVESRTPGVMPAAVHPDANAKGGFVFRVIRLDDGIHTSELTIGLDYKNVTPVNLRDEPQTAQPAVDFDHLTTTDRIQNFHLE